jgi:hypothetical protein
LTSFALQADGFVPILFPRSDKPEVGARLQKFGSLVNSYRAGRPPTGLLDPSHEALAPAQYLVARELSEIQRGGWSVRNIGGIATGTIRPDNPLTTTTSLSPEQLATLFRDNPFWVLPMESMYWSFPRFKLPPGSSVELYHIPSSPETGPEKRGVRIRKEPFFLYQVELEPVGAINGLPNGVDLPEQPKSPLFVVFIKVRVAATFLRMTSDNRAEGVKQWAVWLTGQLKERFADDR